MVDNTLIPPLKNIVKCWCKWFFCRVMMEWSHGRYDQQYLDICIDGWIMKNIYRCIVSAFDHVNVIRPHKDLDVLVVLDFHAVSLPTTYSAWFSCSFSSNHIYIYIHRYIWELSLTNDSDWTCWTKISLMFEQLLKDGMHWWTATQLLSERDLFERSFDEHDSEYVILYI